MTAHDDASDAPYGRVALAAIGRRYALHARSQRWGERELRSYLDALPDLGDRQNVTRAALEHLRYLQRCAVPDGPT